MGDTPDWPSPVGRRAVLAGALGLALPAGVAAGRPGHPVPFGTARRVDVDRDGAADVALVGTDDPAGGGREGVVQATSDGRTTPDYAFAAVEGRSTTLGDPGEFRYDYYVGADNRAAAPDGLSAAPDEVWLLLESDGAGDRIVFRTLADPRPREQWRRRDLAREVRGELGVDPESAWKVVDLDAMSFERVGTDLVSAYGPATAVAGVAIGRGDPLVGPEAVVDTYYHGLVVGGESVEIPTTGSRPSKPLVPGI